MLHPKEQSFDEARVFVPENGHKENAYIIGQSSWTNSSWDRINGLIDKGKIVQVPGVRLKGCGLADQIGLGGIWEETGRVLRARPKDQSFVVVSLATNSQNESS